MSIYVRCPSCGAILADKELEFIKFKEQLDIKNLSEKEKKEEIEKFLNSIPFNDDDIEFMKYKKELETKKLPKDKKKEEIKKYLEQHPPKYCCKMRIYTACDYSKTVI